MKKKEVDTIEEAITPSQKVINALYNTSYYGKDLLEASGKNNKASILLRDKIDELCSIFAWSQWQDAGRSQFQDSIGNMLESFAKFIYTNNEQVRYFCETFIRRYNYLLEIELTSKPALPQQ